MNKARSPRARGSLRALALGSGSIAIAMAILNVASYLFTLIASRLLGPREYGALAALLGVLMVGTVLSLGLQATGARRTAVDPSQARAISDAVVKVGVRAGLALSVVFLLAAPLIHAAFSLTSWWPTLLLAGAAFPTTLMGAQSGVLQGRQRWLPLGAILASAGLSRFVMGVAGIWLRPDVTGAMAGVAVGTFVPTAVGWWVLRDHRPREDTIVRPRQVVRELAHNSHALLAFLALSNVDVVIARIVLNEHRAGLYAGGLIIAKAVMFLPQFIVVVVFPSLSARKDSRRTYLIALGIDAALGIAVILATLAASGLALQFVGGHEYAAVQNQLWLFAVLGTLLAMLHLLVHGVVARQHKRLVLLIWALIGVLAVGAFGVTQVTDLVTLVVAADALLTVALIATVAFGSSPKPTARTGPASGSAPPS